MLGEVTFIGRVGNDLEYKTYSGERSGGYVRISLAVTQYNKQQELRETEWYPIVAFDKRAEILAQYVSKGQEICLTCRVLMKKRKLKENELEQNERKDVTLVVSGFQFIGGQKREDKIDDTLDSKQKDEQEEDDAPIPFL